MAELKKIKQRSKAIKKFVQKFKRVVRKNKYKRQLLVKKFKRSINRVIVELSSIIVDIRLILEDNQLCYYIDIFVFL